MGLFIHYSSYISAQKQTFLSYIIHNEDNFTGYKVWESGTSYYKLCVDRVCDGVFETPQHKL